MSAQNGPLITSAESLRILRQQKYNPMRTLKPATLTRALEAFAIGYLREGAILFEEIADRDDTLKSVKPKREKEVSQLDKQVVALPGSGPAGDEQREVLEDFWNNVRATNAYDRNERGGFRRLVKQMMSAVSYRYAPHHIVWRPSNGNLYATFEFVPLWLFENRTGSLRYLRDPFSQEGDVLDPSEWMVTYGDGLMIACSIGFLAKRSAFNDWLIFSEKFSVPGVLGRTSSGKDTPEGQAMRAAVESFGHDWTGVIYGDDGTHDKPIEIIQAAGNPSGMPMPAVVERVDRKFAALYRGADLSTMSAGGGEGTGASLQGDEKKILLADDAETINETLADISRIVLEWHYGRGVRILAKVQLMVPSDEDEKFYLESVKVVKEMGVRISKDAVLERLGIQEADDGEIALGETQDLKTQDARPEEEVNAGEVPSDQSAVISEEMQALRMALAADMQPLGDALFSAYQAGDAAAMTAALKKISQSMPELAGDATALSEELSGRMVAAFLGEDAEEVANDGNSPGAKLGWETRRANGWVPAPRLITPQEADAELDKGFFVANRAGEKIRFGAELKRKLDDKVINDDDRAARKKRLRWAKLAVSEGSHETTKRHGNVRTIYAKTFRQGPKHQDVEVIVDTINGYAWNIMVKGGSPNALR
jgi:phage gp29-like protein